MNETGVGERKSIPNVDELYSTKKKTKVRKNRTQTPLGCSRSPCRKRIGVIGSTGDAIRPTSLTFFLEKTNSQEFKLKLNTRNLDTFSKFSTAGCD